MTAPRPTPPVVRLLVTRRPAIDTEGPYLDDDADRWSHPTIDGSLALAFPLVHPGPPPRLRLLPRLESGVGDDAVAQARLWEDEPTRPTPVGEPAGPPTEESSAEVSFDPVATPRPALPPPGPHAASLVRVLLEVLSGDRSVRQLARCTSAAVYDDLETLVQPRSARPWAGSLRRLMLCEPVPGVAEVTAIVVQGARTVAMALRMEGMDGRWQLTALQLG